MKNIVYLTLTTDKEKELSFINYTSHVCVRVNGGTIDLGTVADVTEKGAIGQIHYTIEANPETSLEEILLGFVHGQHGDILQWGGIFNNHQPGSLELRRNGRGIEFSFVSKQTYRFGEYVTA